MIIEGTAVATGDESRETNAGRSIALLPTLCRIDLKRIDDVRVEMARVYRDMRAAS